MKNLLICVALSVTSVGAMAASAFTEAKDAVTYRKNSFQLIRHNFADLGDIVKGQVAFDAERVQRRTQALTTLTTLPWETFAVEGVDKIKSDAKPEVWSKNAEFEKLAKKFQADAIALNEAAAVGTLDALKPAFGNFAKNCKACHDSFKE